MRVSVCVPIAVLTGLAGCAGVKVADSAGKDVKGIPFYVKVPWRVQETQLASRELLVSFVVTEVSTDPESHKSTDGRTAKVPVDERLEDSPSAREAIKHFVLGLDRGLSFDAAVAKLTEAGSSFNAFWSKEPATAEECHRKYDVVANSWSTTMVANTKFYYIEPRNPFIGSSSADIHLGDDGTLSESSTSVTDNTASTLLALTPVTALLSKVLGVADTTIAQTQTAPASAAGLSALRKKPATAPASQPPVVTVRVDVVETPAKTVYQLRRAVDVNAEAEAANNDKATHTATAAAGTRPHAPLTLCDAFNGKDSTELVSVTTLPADGGKDDDDGKDAWQVAGKLVPPKADKAATKKK